MSIETTHAQLHRNFYPRRVGICNWVGINTLIQKEIGRFLNVYMQTLVAPVVTLLMFFTVFHLSIPAHSSGSVFSGPLFLGPGLLMMTMIQNAFANTSSSLIIAKVQGNIVDVLMPPLAPWELLTGLLIGAVVRAMFIGVIGFLCLRLIIPMEIHAPIWIISFAILANIGMAALGIIAGLWAEKFDHMATVTNFIVTPLTFLSGTFYALNALPEMWQDIALLNPIFYMIDGFRSGFLGVSEASRGIGLLYIGVLDVIMLGAAWWMLRTGYKTKF